MYRVELNRTEPGISVMEDPISELWRCEDLELLPGWLTMREAVLVMRGDKRFDSEQAQEAVSIPAARVVLARWRSVV